MLIIPPVVLAICSLVEDDTTISLLVEDKVVDSALLFEGIVDDDTS